VNRNKVIGILTICLILSVLFTSCSFINTSQKLDVSKSVNSSTGFVSDNRATDNIDTNPNNENAVGKQASIEKIML
jgi:hypothetical protein